ncbi:MAG TPA: hypothetical protein VHM91_02605 [Verrucomicrobiales bacterium]|jgi:hypothetical protein|nr:hypothetical protein [Verrucomicrobiales bacterium]
MSDDPLRPAKPRAGTLFRILVIACGLAAITAGIIQMKQGVGEIQGGADEEVKKLAQQSDASAAEGDRLTQEAAPLFKTVFESVDKAGLEKARAQNTDAASKAAELFGKASEQYRLAGQKLDEAIARHPGERMKAFLDAKSRACKGLAEVRGINQELCRMFSDESIKTAAELQPKLTEAVNRRNQAEQAAVVAAKEGDKIAAESKK